MAINPTISLAFKQPEVEGPMEGFQKTIALKNMLDQSAINRQMMQLRGQEIEQKKIEADNLRFAQEGRQVFADAMRKYTSPDPDGGVKHNWAAIEQHTIQYGHPEIAEAVRKHRTELEKEVNENLKNQLDNRTKAFTSVSQVTDPILEKAQDPNADQDALAQEYGARLQQIQGMGLPQGMIQLPPQWGPEAFSALERVRDTAQTHADEKDRWERRTKGPGEVAKSAEAVRHNNNLQAVSINKDAFIQKQASDPEFRKQFPGTFEEGFKQAKAEIAAEKATGPEAQELQSFLAGDAIDPEFPDVDKPRTPMLYAAYKQWLTAGGSVPTLGLSERPTAEDSAKPVRGTGLTQGGLYQSAVTFGLTNRMPTMGFGSKGPVAAARTAVINTASALAQAAGVDLATVQAEYKANQTSLSKLMTQYNMTAVNEQSALKYFDLVKQAGERMDKESWQIGIPALNEWVRTGQVKFTDNPSVNNYLGALQTALTEYAKVVTGQTGGAAVTDSARSEARDLIAKGLSTGTVNDYIDNIVTPEMKNRTDSYLGQINGISSTIAKFLSGGASTPAPAPGGKTEAKAPDFTKGKVKIGGKEYGVGDVAPNGKKITAVDPATNRYKVE